MIELCQVGEDGESVGAVALRHVGRLKEGGNTQRLLGQCEDQAAVPVNRIISVKSRELISTLWRALVMQLQWLSNYSDIRQQPGN